MSSPRLLRSLSFSLLVGFGLHLAPLGGLPVALAQEEGGGLEGPKAPTAPTVVAPKAPEVPGATRPASTVTPGTSGKAPRPKAKKERRGGINPCMTPDPGFGIYDGWSRNISSGQMIAPHRGGVGKDGGFDLVVHFHGHEPVRKEFVKAAKGIVLVGIDLGIGSGVYSNAYAAPNAFTNLLGSVEAEMSKRTGKKAWVRKLALSSWSAGYGAIEQILTQPAGKKVDAVILLDSLHTGYTEGGTGELKTDQIAMFADFAKKAARGQGLLYLSHSSIIPPGYASTTEVAHYLEGELRGRARKASKADVLGLDMFERFDRGNVHIRGYTGNDKPDHCAHLGLMAEAVRSFLNPRWKGPRGSR